MTDAAPPAHAGHGSKAYRAYVLGALLVVYTFNFIDRILIGIVQEPLRHEFNLSDTQLGLLGGPSFAILYTLLGLPIAWLAERANRVSIVAVGVAVWSAMTAACGLAANFPQLILARVGVGIGEAACTPPSHSVISDYFPSNRRATALAIYSLGVPIGTMLAAVGGGWLAQNYDWRAAFFILGAPGILVALIFKLTVKEPPRAGAAAKAPSIGETLKALMGRPTFWHNALAGALVSFVGYGTSQFLPSHFVRTFELSLSEASLYFGVISGISAVLGTFLGGFVLDRLAPRHPRVPTWLPAAGLGVAIPLYLLAFTQGAFLAALIPLLIAVVFHYLYLGPMYAVTQGVSEPRMRATATAILLLIVNLIGYGLGPLFVGQMSDFFAGMNLEPQGLSVAACADQTGGACAAGRAFGLKYALLSTTVFLIWAALHFLLAGRTWLKDRVG